MYADKNVIFEQQNIGDGIKLIVNDTIIDLSIESFIDSAANSLQV
jgi:hypothetical protein